MYLFRFYISNLFNHSEIVNFHSTTVKTHNNLTFPHPFELITSRLDKRQRDTTRDGCRRPPGAVTSTMPTAKLKLHQFAKIPQNTYNFIPILIKSKVSSSLWGSLMCLRLQFFFSNALFTFDLS